MKEELFVSAQGFGLMITAFVEEKSILLFVTERKCRKAKLSSPRAAQKPSIE